MVSGTDFINSRNTGGGPMSDTADQLPTEIAPTGRLLTAAEFHRLADVPPEVEWFANLSNPHTRRTSSSRQAMMCARVTVRNSSGRVMPVKRMKSFTAFS